MNKALANKIIAVTAARPGDVLVLKVQGFLSVEQHLRIRNAIAGFMPDGVDFLVVDRNVDVGVFRPLTGLEPEPIAERAISPEQLGLDTSVLGGEPAA